MYRQLALLLTLLAATLGPASGASATTGAPTYKCQRYSTFVGPRAERAENELWLLHIQVSSVTMAHLRHYWPPPKGNSTWGPLLPCGVARGVEGEFMNKKLSGDHRIDDSFTSRNGVVHDWYTCTWLNDRTAEEPEQPIEAEHVVCSHHGRYPVRIWFSGTLET